MSVRNATPAVLVKVLLSASVCSAVMSPKELDAEFDRIEKENAARPFIVTRTKWLSTVFDHARPIVAKDAVFVDRLAGGWLIDKRRVERCRAFVRNTLGLEDCDNYGRWAVDTHGAYVSHLDWTHTCPDWESVLKLGIPGLARRARDRRQTAANDDERLFLDSVIAVYEAAGRLLVRWATAADEIGNAEVAETLRALAEHEPRTLREALQLMLVYDRMQETEGEPVRSQGLFDRLYIQFYRDDIKAGRETHESAKALVKAVFDVFFKQGHPNGKNIAFGGLDRNGIPVWNELTEMAFELHYELNRVNPKLTFRYSKKTPEEQLMKVARCVADGRNSIVFLNDETSFESFRRRGKEDGDAADAVLIGCYEPSIMGREVIASMSAWINMAKPLEYVFARADLPQTYENFEAMYFEELDRMLRLALSKTRRIEEHWYELNPSPLMSGTFRDAVAKAKDAYAGGCKYNQSGVMCAGLATVADSLAAVRYLVQQKRSVTMADIKAALDADWKGYEELQREVRRVPPKWGNNNEQVDALGRKLYDFVTKTVNATANGHGGTFQAGFWSIDDDLKFGALTGATPDGRSRGETLSRNNIATIGCGKEGPTALLLSCAKLDQAECPNGFILDLILPVSAKKDIRGAQRVADMLRVFAKLGGHCVHFNCFDSSLLRDAQAHPEKYSDLQVRVCGWNVRWNDLSKKEQDEYIRRAEAQGI